jgi:hypothetical protein
MSMRRGRVALQAVLTPPLVLALAWGAAALWFDGPAQRLAAGALAAAFASAALFLLVRLRPYGRGMLAALALFGVVLAWWLTIPPRNDRDWLPDVDRTATAAVAGSRLTVGNLRNFDYRSETDFTPRWETRTYDLDRLCGVDLFLCFWGPTAIAHTIASWEFAEGPPLAISIETRKEKGETYSAVRGFFRQFEVYYVVADERDVVRLRTNHRGERLYLYRIRMPVELARELLLAYLAEVDRLSRHPRWYNALTHNCTTAIRYHLKHLGIAQRMDWRILANGQLPELMYARASVDTRLPLAELQRRSEITARAREAGQDAMFSARIREGVPDPRLPAEGQ